jgi:uncharacterized membrane protein YphA (DoxX/SURF4 family)
LPVDDAEPFKRRKNLEQTSGLTDTTEYGTDTKRKQSSINTTLWILQALLAALFLFAGVMKLIMPIEEMTKDMPQMPGIFLRFIAVCEVLGAIGLILPGLLRIRPELTVLAAVGLIIIMIGATAVTAMTGGGAVTLLPLVVGILTAFVAYGRWRMVPLRGSRAGK